MRKHLFNIIDNESRTLVSTIYGYLMLLAIFVSIIPLMTRTDYAIFRYFDYSACVVFIFDYLAKWATADYRTGKSSLKSFLLYPFTAWAIFDLFTILPTLNILNRSLVSLRVVRVFKVFRMLRVFERSSHLTIISNVIRSESRILGNVLALCVIYIFVSALVMFNHEETIATFLDALYWATTALTTVGYGDVCPNSDSAKIISMISSLFGIAVVALPSGIITARYLEELTNSKNQITTKTPCDSHEGQGAQPKT